MMNSSEKLSSSIVISSIIMSVIGSVSIMMITRRFVNEQIRHQRTTTPTKPTTAAKVIPRQQFNSNNQITTTISSEHTKEKEKTEGPESPTVGKNENHISHRNIQQEKIQQFQLNSHHNDHHTTTTTSTTQRCTSTLTTTTTTTTPVEIMDHYNRNKIHTKIDVYQKRKKYFSKSLSISYENSDPLMFVRGSGTYLFDENNVAYLDTRNNVAHCGHCHPRIVAAVQQQVSMLNTNTRYLHPTITTLAETLLQLFPSTSSSTSESTLDTVFFCNSGSEANDLALRLARAYSGGSTNTIVVEHAYHGHTIATLEVSPYKYEHKPILEHTLYNQPNVGPNENHSINTIPATNTTTTAKTSTTTLKEKKQTRYSFFSPGEHIWKVPCPDTYRGLHRLPMVSSSTRNDKDENEHPIASSTHNGELLRLGERYGQYVRDACDYYTNVKKEKVRAFILEGGMSVAGVILPPPGYLKCCVDAVRHAGGLYIADEVQTGFGRLGTTMWAFEQNQNQQQQHPVDDNGTDNHPVADEIIIPDIVTVGKPFGNGMALAAVITSRKVAECFEQYQIEYFNTFGGNPVCAIAGLEMLHTLQHEKLQNNADTVGSYLKTKLKLLQKEQKEQQEDSNTSLANYSTYIGDVRGSGLFIGIDLVQNPETREPATMETSYICTVLKTKYHILTSIDGPYNNVIVLKPPMVFQHSDADYFLTSFQHVLQYELPYAIQYEKLRETNNNNNNTSTITPT